MWKSAETCQFNAWYSENQAKWHVRYITGSEKTVLPKEKSKINLIENLTESMAVVSLISERTEHLWLKKMF